MVKKRIGILSIVAVLVISLCVIRYDQQHWNAHFRWIFSVNSRNVTILGGSVKGTVYVRSGTTLYALNSMSGEVKRILNLKEPVESPTVLDTTGNAYFLSPSNGKVYNMHAINLDTGKDLWNNKTGSEHPLLGGTNRLIAYSNEVEAYSTATGKRAWVFNPVVLCKGAKDAQTKNTIDTVVYADNQVFVSCLNNSVYLLNKHTGGIQFYLALKSNPRHLGYPEDVGFYTDANGNVYCSSDNRVYSFR